jgi:predicted metal-binding protein
MAKMIRTERTVTNEEDITMTRVAIVGCRRVQDHLCIACAKCLKAIRKRDGEFKRYENDEIELVALGDCGDCPGLVVPKVTLMNEINTMIGNEFDVIHFGTCVVKAKNTGQCPLDFEKITKIMKDKFDKNVIIGTHDY